MKKPKTGGGRGLRRKVCLGLAILALGLGSSGCVRPPARFDVVVVGGTPAGVTAAVAAARSGYRVCLVAERAHVGGLMASGLCDPTPGNPDRVGGLAREVFYGIYTYYLHKYGPGSAQLEYCTGGLRYEPHVAESVFEHLLAASGVTVLRGLRFLRTDQRHNQIQSLWVRDDSAEAEREIRGKVFVDATYCGDVYAESGAGFRLGREARADYGESLAGRVYWDPDTGELLPGSSGAADSLIQAWGYLLCLTDSAANQAVWPEPVQYDPSRYRRLLEFIRLKNPTSPGDFFSFSQLPNRKFQAGDHWACWMSADMIGGSQACVETEFEERERVEREHMEYLLGLYKFLRTDPGVPEPLRRQFARFAPAADEFADSRHLPFQIRVDEARRLVGPYTFKESDALTDTLKEDAIALGGSLLYSQEVSGWNYEYPRAEGFFLQPCNPAQVPYRVLQPAWVRNLAVAVAVSASHVAQGSLRGEPVLMELGQAAGLAAALCLKLNCEIDEVPASDLQALLRRDGAILSTAEARPWQPEKNEKP